MKTIIFSRKDRAGTNITDILVENYSLPVHEFGGEIIRMDYVPEYLGETDLCIVASKHKSESGIPTLTIHSPGNFGVARAGGEDKRLGVAPALYLTGGLRQLKAAQLSGFEVCFEVTHHGPTILPCPIVFVEVGSTEKEWSNLDACRAAAETIKNLYDSEPKKLPSAIGFGGGHYAKKFSLVEDYALGHICPKYALEHLNREMVSEMVEKTVPMPKIALVEKKGVGKEKNRIIEIISETGLELIYI